MRSEEHKKQKGGGAMEGNGWESLEKINKYEAKIVALEMKIRMLVDLNDGLKKVIKDNDERDKKVKEIVFELADHFGFID